MALRAEQWMIIAVGAIGAGAVYLLATAKPRTTPIDPGQPGRVPTPAPGAPVALLQNIIGKPPAPAGSHSAALRTGQPYRGRIELPAGSSSNPAQIRAELERFSFGDVTIYEKLADAQANDAIPLADALANPTPQTRWFAAVWRGESHVYQIPPTIVLLWPTAELPRPRPAFAPMLFANQTQFAG